MITLSVISCILSVGPCWPNPAATLHRLDVAPIRRRMSFEPPVTPGNALDWSAGAGQLLHAPVRFGAHGVGGATGTVSDGYVNEHWAVVGAGFVASVVRIVGNRGGRGVSGGDVTWA